MTELVRVEIAEMRGGALLTVHSQGSVVTIETAPKDGTAVLVLYEVGHDKYRYAAQAVSYGRHWEGAMDDDWVPTHWAPLNTPDPVEEIMALPAFQPEEEA